jgi:transposase
MLVHDCEANMHPRHTVSTIPSDTIKSARAILGRENFYLKVGDNWESLLAGAHAPNSENGQGSQYWMVPTLAIATVLQYKEKLSDRQAEEASRLRVDWKYALHLSMPYPGLSRVMLCKYRQRVYHDPNWQEEFQAILDCFITQGLFDECQQAHLLAFGLLDEVCSQSRLEEVILAQRRALEALATKQPKWLRNVILPNWYARYHLFKATPDLPHNITEQAVMAESIGADILYLFNAIAHSDLPEPGDLEEIKALQQVWLEQFELSGNGGARRLPLCSFCGSLETSREMSR